MHLGGRYTMTRLYGALGISARHVLRRPRAQWPATLTRYAVEDWAVDPSGLVLPAMRGGAGWSSATQFPTVELGYPNQTAGTQTAVALNTDYTYNSAGNAIASRVTTPSDKTLTSVYYFMTAHTGTPEVQIDLHTDGSSKPAASPTALGNSTPGGTGWKSLGSLSQALTAGTKYWIVISDNNGSTDGTATVLRSTNGMTTTPERQVHAAFSTTDGWASVVTAASAVGAIILGFSGSTAIGNPITASGSAANNTNRRGWYLSSGLTESLKLLGMGQSVGSAITNLASVEAYEGTTLPGGTTAASGTAALYLQTAAGPLGGCVFSSAYTAPKATAIRVVFTFSGNSSSVARLQIGTGADATLRSAVWGGGSHYWGQANGTTDWSNDNQDEYPNTYLIVEDQVAIASGGVIGGPNKRAGMQ